MKVFIGANSDPHIINDPITGNQRPPDPDDAEGYAIIPPHNYQKWEQRREWQGKVMHFVTMTGVRILIAAALFHLVKAMVGR